MTTGTRVRCLISRMIERPSSSGMLRLRRDRGAQAAATVAERDREAVHAQVVADYLAGRRLVVDHHDVLRPGHG
jgi:hypothetical protein